MRICLLAIASLLACSSLAVAEEPNAAKLEPLRKGMKMFLRKLHDSTASYFDVEVTGKDGKVRTGLLPASSPLTPKQSCCALPGKVCDDNSPGWDTPGWKTLYAQTGTFHVAGYQFEYTAKGTGKKASVVIRALGDPLCDGHEEIWELAFHALPEGGLEPYEDKQVRRVK